MATNSDTTRLRPRQAKEVTVGFSPESVAAPFLLRCAALIIDYLLFACVPVLFLLFARFLGEDGTNLLKGDLNSFGWLIAVLIGAANIILLPALIGRSVGKLATGLRIVSTDGSVPTVRKVLLRQTVGYILTLLTFGLGFFFSALNAKGRALHDLLFRTTVIQAKKEQLIS